MTSAAAAQGRMPLGAHLREARRRMVRAAAVLAVATVLGFLVSDLVLDALRTPIEALAAERNASLNYDSVTGAFDLKIKIAVAVGIALSSPVWLLELLGFARPGLTRRERRYAFGFLLAALPLFAAGCATGFVLFPHMVEVLASFASSDDSTLLAASTYVDFVMKLMLASGVAFLLPVVIVALNFAGILPARTLARSWRVWVIAIVLFSAIATPAADLMSMFFVAVPMAALFLAAQLIATVHDRRLARRLAAGTGTAAAVAAPTPSLERTP